MSAASLFSFQDRQEIFAAAIDRLADRPFANPEFFTAQEIAALKAAALALPFRKASPKVGNNVHQDFEICFPAPLEGVFAQLARGLKGWLPLCRQRIRNYLNRLFLSMILRCSAMPLLLLASGYIKMR